MKKKKEPKYVEKVKDISAAARENLAAQILDVDRILVEIIKLAEMGFQEYRIKSSNAVDLQFTNAAERAEKKLAELGFSLKWVRTLYPPEQVMKENGLTKKVNHTNMELNVNELLIMWYSKSKMMSINFSTKEDDEESKNTRI